MSAPAVPPACGRTAAVLTSLALLASGLPGAAPAQESGERERGLPEATAADSARSAPDSAQAAPGDARVDSLTARVASELRCPVCRSQSVLESSSDLANRMQSVIRERLARGESPAEVQAYFVDKYGEWILLRPRAEGINLLVYVLPALALVGGGWIVARRLNRWSSEGVTDEAGPGAPGGEDRGAERTGTARSDDLDLSEDDRDWLERELRRRD